MQLSKECSLQLKPKAMGTQILRIGYCRFCDKENQPHSMNEYVGCLDGESMTLFRANARNNGTRGITPHIYKLIKGNEIRVFYQSICTMCGCGSYLGLNDQGKETLYLDRSKWSAVVPMNINNWNALVLFTDSGFEI